MDCKTFNASPHVRNQVGEDAHSSLSTGDVTFDMTSMSTYENDALSPDHPRDKRGLTFESASDVQATHARIAAEELWWEQDEMNSAETESQIVGETLTLDEEAALFLQEPVQAPYRCVNHPCALNEADESGVEVGSYSPRPSRWWTTIPDKPESMVPPATEGKVSAGNNLNVWILSWIVIKWKRRAFRKYDTCRSHRSDSVKTTKSADVPPISPPLQFRHSKDGATEKLDQVAAFYDFVVPSTTKHHLEPDDSSESHHPAKPACTSQGGSNNTEPGTSMKYSYPSPNTTPATSLTTRKPQTKTPEPVVEHDIRETSPASTLSDGQSVKHTDRQYLMSSAMMRMQLLLKDLPTGVQSTLLADAMLRMQELSKILDGTDEQYILETSPKKELLEVQPTPSLPKPTIEQCKTWCWEVPTVLEQMLQWPASVSEVKESLEQLVVVIQSPSSLGEPRFKATTCGIWISQHWGKKGMSILHSLCASLAEAYKAQQVDSLAIQAPHEVTVLHDKVIWDTRSVTVQQVSDFVRRRGIKKVVEDVITFLCEAARLLDSHDGIVLSTMKLSFESNRQPVFDLSKRSIETGDSACWKSLFQSCVVVQDPYPTLDIPFIRSSCKGLEMPFHLMTLMAAVEYHVLLNGGLVFVGYQTALALTELKEGFAQFHLTCTDEGQINVGTLGFNLAPVKEIPDFSKLRCFLGWCDSAKICLGTQEYFSRVGYTKGKEKRNTAYFDGFSLGTQLISSAPIQAGFTGMANFRFQRNVVRFTQDSNYARLLRDTAKQSALIYASGEKRAWLVPRLSLLLHMCHSWVLCKGVAPDRVPFVDPHFDADAVVQALDGVGGTVVCGHGDDSLLLRKLLLGLNINLSTAKRTTQEPGKCQLYAFEYMDLVAEPGSGCLMKEFGLFNRAARTWLPLAAHADSIVVCESIGQVIFPDKEEHRRCATCNAPPVGCDFLVAHVATLRTLIERCHLEGSWTLQNDGAMMLPESPFDVCQHDVALGVKVWTAQCIFQMIKANKSILQRLNPNSGISVQRANVFPVALPPTAALVFGSPYR